MTPPSSTDSYKSYSRAYIVEGEGKPAISGSADPAFHGDADRWNPEELFLSSLSACHKLWFLHLCAVSGVSVEDYEDHAEGLMEENADGRGRFISVTLHPKVTLRAGDVAKAHDLHQQAHQKCFIANSVNFPVRIDARFLPLPS